ncbi:MAG: sugar nucleotide-binding protein [Actinobacteria bacterium]|uniref:Unannotated protein n=1 Tax=freshwater metagenome TaxID=449393 RepID=A0A6J7GQ07_9ZZZZ|nr:sugar nucleotide-binding protein [Actinomycetota bacterium]
MISVSSQPKPSWLITGANGFLGSNAGYFLQGKVQRIGLCRRPPNAALIDEFIEADLSDSASTTAGILRTRPSVILHTAALASHEECERDPKRAHEINVLGTQSVAQAAQQVGALLILISTDAVFDGQRGNYTEADEPSPFSVYGETKLLGEAAALKNCEKTIVARTNFFGWSPTRNRSILEFFVHSLEQGMPISGYTDFVVTSIYAQNLLEALWELTNQEFRGLINIASSDPLSKFDFGRQVAQSFGLDESLISPNVSPQSSGSLSRRRDISLSTRLLAAQLGTSIRTQLEGITEAHLHRAEVTSAIST